MKKILVFGITDNPGGVESVIMNYYRKIDRSKIQFDFLCNTQNVAYEDEIRRLGGTIYRITARSKNRIKYKKDMKSFFEKHAIDYSIVWVNVCSLANIDYLIYAKKYNIKTRIIHCHNSQNMDSKLRCVLHFINRFRIGKYANNFWTCNEKSNQWFYGKNIIKKKKIIVVNNAIDTKQFKFNKSVRDKYREDLGIKDKLVIGHVGRFHFQKNQLFLLDVFNEIQKKESNSILLLIGQGEDKEKIVNRIKELNLEKKVKLLGIRDDINKLMCAMDVFLFPSLFEGLGIVLIEAQATGLPVVSSCDNTPASVKLSDNFKFLSLNDSVDKWVEAVMSFKQSKRNSNNEFIKNSNYDINDEVKKMEDFFERN